MQLAVTTIESSVQILAIEFVYLANEFAPLAVEFVTLAYFASTELAAGVNMKTRCSRCVMILFRCNCHK